MLNLSITKNQFSDLLNLQNGVFYPLKHFVNEKEFKDIMYKKKINTKFFPMPIFFGISKKRFYEIKNYKFVRLIYKNKYLAFIKIKSIFKFNSIIFGKKIFGKNFKKHPYFKKYIKENFAFVDFEFKKLIKKNMKYKNFVSPKKFKKMIKKKTNKADFLAGFHTRNVPHMAHQWVHKFMLKNYNNILVQPLIGQYKKNEYNDDIIIKTNKVALGSYKNNNSFFIPYFSYPRYGGPLEAALHAIVRKNYGCTHFWIGRDHAGYKKFFSKYASQKFCLKMEKNIGLKIIAQKEPYYCSGCKKIVNKKCKNKLCNKFQKKEVSGTKIRKFIKINKPIPEYLMDKKISKLLNKKTVLVN